MVNKNRMPSKMQMEAPFFIENNANKIFAVLHRPKPNENDNQNNPLTGIVFCHPFAEEKLIRF